MTGGPTCLDCTHVFTGVKGAYCEVFNDILVNLSPCPAFEGDEEPDLPVHNPDTDLAPIINLADIRRRRQQQPDPA